MPAALPLHPGAASRPGGPAPELRVRRDALFRKVGPERWRAGTRVLLIEAARATLELTGAPAAPGRSRGGAGRRHRRGVSPRRAAPGAFPPGAGGVRTGPERAADRRGPCPCRRRVRNLLVPRLPDRTAVFGRQPFPAADHSPALRGTARLGLRRERARPRHAPPGPRSSSPGSWRSPRSGAATSGSPT